MARATPKPVDVDAGPVDADVLQHNTPQKDADADVLQHNNQAKGPVYGTADHPAAALEMTDAELVRHTLRALLADATAPAAARAQAARTLAEMASLLGRHAPPAPPPTRRAADMTRAELEAELATLAPGD